MEKGARTSSRIGFILAMLCCVCVPLSAQQDFRFDLEYPASFVNDHTQSTAFQAMPASAPWLVNADSDFPYQPHGQTKTARKMHPALRSFLRFFIVSAGAMPITVGLSSLLYISPPVGWSTTQQTQVVLITGASAAITVGFIDLIIDLVQARKKEASASS